MAQKIWPSMAPPSGRTDSIQCSRRNIRSISDFSKALTILTQTNPCSTDLYTMGLTLLGTIHGVFFHTYSHLQLAGCKNPVLTARRHDGTSLDQGPRSDGFANAPKKPCKECLAAEVVPCWSAWLVKGFTWIYHLGSSSRCFFWGGHLG